MKEPVFFSFWLKSSWLNYILSAIAFWSACLPGWALNLEKSEGLPGPKVEIRINPGYDKYEDVSGYVNITEATGGFGMGITTTDYSQYLLGISTINGYVINSHFLTGIGVGLYAYNGGMAAPVYIDIRYSFNESKFTPYIFGDGGILLYFEEMDAPGLFINPGLGIITKISDKLAVNIGTGLFVQRMPRLASFINFKLGLIFRTNPGDPCKIAGLRTK